MEASKFEDGENVVSIAAFRCIYKTRSSLLIFTTFLLPENPEMHCCSFIFQSLRGRQLTNFVPIDLM